MTHPLTALLAGVTRYRLTGYDAGTQPDGAGDFVAYHEVLAALSAAPADDVRRAALMDAAAACEDYGAAGQIIADAILALIEKETK